MGAQTEVGDPRVLRQKSHGACGGRIVVSSLERRVARGGEERRGEERKGDDDGRPRAAVTYSAIPS